MLNRFRMKAKFPIGEDIWFWVNPETFEMTDIEENANSNSWVAVKSPAVLKADDWFVVDLVTGEIFFEELPKDASLSQDNVNHPSHYNFGKIEVIEFIEDQQLSYHLGNTVKYVCRAGRKDSSKEIEDLKKAAWYLNRRIEILAAQKEGREALRPNSMVKGTK